MSSVHHKLAACVTLGAVEPRTVRLLHVHSGNLFGGVESMLLTQFRQHALWPSLQSSFALCFEGRFGEEIRAAGASVFSLGEVRIRKPLAIHRARKNLRDLLRGQEFDVTATHSAWTQAIFGPTMRELGLPLVRVMHSPASEEDWLERWARKTQPALVIHNSHFTARTTTLYPRVPTETVYCPVAPHGSRRSDASQVRLELETDADAIVIIQVSRMEAWKGHREHLEALARLQEVPGWVCWQVGGAQTSQEENYLKELKSLASRLGISQRIRFLGQRTDVDRLLAAADIYCQPNLGPEPFGISLIEALYAQLPIVTSDLGGACEIVDESCGVLTTPGVTDELAMALKSLIEDQTRRLALGEGGPRRAKELCDPQARLKQFYEAVARASRPCDLGS